MYGCRCVETAGQENFRLAAWKSESVFIQVRNREIGFSANFKPFDTKATDTAENNDPVSSP